MTINIAGSNCTGFGVSQAGFVYNYGGAGAPAAGQWDVLFVNSDATIQTPAGFTLLTSFVGQQGAYAFARKAVGGEAATVTITTGIAGGPFNSTLGWARLTNGDSFDKTIVASAGSPGTSIPAISSGQLAGSTELALAYSAMHNLAAVPSNPVWGGGFSALCGASQGGVGVSSTANFLGQSNPVGPTSVTPTLTWTGTTNDREAFIITFTETADCPPCPPCPERQTCACTTALNLTAFAPIATGIGQCVVDALELTAAGAPCRQCLLLPTAVIPWDGCDCDCQTPGQVAQAITQVFNAETFPIPFVGNWKRCGPHLLVANITLSVTRCVPVMDDHGQPPSCQDELAAAVTLENDRAAILQALACCLADLTAGTIRAYNIGPSVTIGESGGCAGVETTYQIAIASCLCG